MWMTESESVDYVNCYVLGLFFSRIVLLIRIAHGADTNVLLWYNKSQ